MKIINPTTEATIKEIKEDNDQKITEKFMELKRGQKVWKSIPLKNRIQCLSNFGKLVEENIDELAQILTEEMGKPLSQSVNEIKGADARLKFFLKNSEKWLADEDLGANGNTLEKIKYEPLGVIGNISAWNYPYLVGYNVFVPALIGGNAVLYKPSEFATLTGLKIEELMIKAGIPEDVFKTAIGGKKAGEHMTKLPLDGYFFTGSYQTGIHIATAVAHKLVPCQMELGGKDPLYVTDKIKDIKKAASFAVEGKFYNNGQSCCAIERIYVHENVFDEFVKEFVSLTESMKVGDPMRDDTDLGPLARRQQLDYLLFQVNDALDKGAKMILGDESIETQGYFFEPTVLTDVSHDMSLMVDETFGPLIGIQKVSNDDEAIGWMQDTDYGLTAAVFSDDGKRAETILEKLDVGTGYWNCSDRVSPNLPWSGRRKSGLGSTLSYQGIRAFVQPKAYHLREW
ncbi:aldehyde dehydrogenase family protein [Flexithrix dorotheae]|uniref:aldehyde dehydrogenase family protein n=1 Tax=Flexithrix dorotheae TaxID=70993 RepID=UPI00036567C4|nr:aldehyde dehydrogenase family protein [Flexithrix dorotheae]